MFNLRIPLLVLVGLSIAFSICIIGTASHTLAVYNSQRDSNPWWMPLWPDHFDTNGTKSLIGSAVAVVLFDAIYLVVYLVPTFDTPSRPTFNALVALATALPCAIVTLATLVYAHILNHNAPATDTLQTWTCAFRSSSTAVDQLDVSSSVSNQQFTQLCHESKFALYGTLVVFLFQGFVMAGAVVNWGLEKWGSHKEKKNGKVLGDQGSDNVHMVGMGVYETKPPHAA
ncbi:hypothetical protein BDY21DRAFT_359851 [Lineolata rhizophorae]|uniref:Uncharacterized protein n=1 Tax=Lineolata rhizophorae TaxID=578093 RepID=A0A6A6PCW4_9PEZI|nr:hypothetical protein BDY21DRAFT_359851 [Lineolata rhizophorae]